MFKITHTTPKRVLRHILRLKREGEAQRDDVDLIEEGRWTGRLMEYLRRIVADERMFDRLPAYRVHAITAEELRRGPVLSYATHGPVIRKRIKTRLTTLASVIEQLEAHIEGDL